MTFIVEHVGNKKEKSNGRPYRSFWLQIVHEGMFMTIRSCTYHVDTGTIQMPYFGQGISLIQFDPLTYRQIEQDVKRTFIGLGEEGPYISEERRKQNQKITKAELKGKKGKKK